MGVAALLQEAALGVPTFPFRARQKDVPPALSQLRHSPASQKSSKVGRKESPGLPVLAGSSATLALPGSGALAGLDMGQLIAQLANAALSTTPATTRGQEGSGGSLVQPCIPEQQQWQLQQGKRQEQEPPLPGSRGWQWFEHAAPLPQKSSSSGRHGANGRSKNRCCWGRGSGGGSNMQPHCPRRAAAAAGMAGRARTWDWDSAVLAPVSRPVVVATTDQKLY
ncbi:hypothetical protein E2320_008651 [Naja naja]|nr:hypothetical protein E2320_008651 [Naja naja]